ncbi:MAG: Thiol:disulfide oxidoreductase related to ResA [uncultured Solirubrobacteraceae bacterium]|uniref:Thiol:disulfide oxidoreductase related to ResA n=1 Tax=uncultured Solirubrobacteraceae bacterium TaxID=1162706 RepID=A0A6J4T3R6_9ACTN|nr:MAG: Thiol:disulfide oxidoreductase related to ResA [uncultured Solirubrobacteraceae bacterium]
MRRTAWILAAAALVAVLVVGILQGSGATEKTPDFDLADAKRTLAGAPGPLAALHGRSNVIEPDGGVAQYEAMLRQVRGYPVVVNAWATWCGPCKLEFPIFQQVSTKLGKRVAFFGLNVSDNRAKADEFLRERPVPYPSLEDGDTRIVQDVGWSGGLPLTIFYDRNGKKFVHQGGYTTQADLIRDIERYAGA